MMSLLASVFTGFGMLFAGLFGSHTPPAPATNSANSNHADMASSSMQHMENRMSGIPGKITAISGSSFTMTGHAVGMPAASSTNIVTYTVDVSSAKVLKFSLGQPELHGSTTPMMASTTQLSLADLKIGGSVLVTGTVSGTSIVAKTVIYGVPPIPGTAAESKGGINMKSSLIMPAKN